MELHLRWAEKFEVVREYPTFSLSTERFPELELEIQKVLDAPHPAARQEALDDLEYKMHHTEERGETIMEIVGPRDHFADAKISPTTDEEGFLKIADMVEEEE